MFFEVRQPRQRYGIPPGDGNVRICRRGAKSITYADRDALRSLLPGPAILDLCASHRIWLILATNTNACCMQIQVLVISTVNLTLPREFQSQSRIKSRTFSNTQSHLQ